MPELLHILAQGVLDYSYTARLLADVLASVPIVLAGAKMAAERILQDAGRPVPWQPWSRSYLSQRGEKALDVTQQAMSHWFNWLAALLVLIASLAYIR